MLLLCFSNVFQSAFSCLCQTTTYTDIFTEGHLLGLGDEQSVSEEKEVSLLGLQARLQL